MFTRYETPGDVHLGEIVKVFDMQGCMAERIVPQPSGRVVRVGNAHIYGGVEETCAYIDYFNGCVPQPFPVSGLWRTEFGLSLIR